MGAVYPSSHGHGFVLHHHSSDNICFLLVCLFSFVCSDIPSWYCAHGPKTLRMMMMVKPQGRKEWKMVRDDEQKYSRSIRGHLIYSGSLFVCFAFFFPPFGHFLKYICMYMRFVLLNCDLNILLFSFCFFINYPHKK